MRLRELLIMIDSHFTLELPKGNFTYETKTKVPEEFQSLEVKRIEAFHNELRIKLEVSKKAPTLEELGYSFETGV
jgi:hypothetical protein